MRVCWLDVNGPEFTAVAAILQANFAGDILNFVLDAFFSGILLADLRSGCGHTSRHEAAR